MSLCSKRLTTCWAASWTATPGYGRKHFTCPAARASAQAMLSHPTMPGHCFRSTSLLSTGGRLSPHATQASFDGLRTRGTNRGDIERHRRASNTTAGNRGRNRPRRINACRHRLGYRSENLAAGLLGSAGDTMGLRREIDPGVERARQEVRGDRFHQSRRQLRSSRRDRRRLARLSRASIGLADPVALAGSVVDPTQFKQTDAGNALLFTAMYKDDIRYIEAWRTWAHWNGKRWELKSDAALLPLARHVTEHMFSWAATLPDDHRTALRKHALATQREQRLHAMINLAKGEPTIRAEPKQFDADPWLLGCEDVTLDLRARKTRLPRREDFITKSTGIDPDPEAACPNWLATLDWTMQGDAATIEHLQRIAGYMLTGSVREEKLFAFFGGGSNGKTTIAMTFLEALGDYAAKGRKDLLLQSQGEKGAASPDVAALHGKRLVVVSETDEGCTLAEAQVKEITSNEPITARKLHCDPFTFYPSQKIILMTNHRPFVKGSDEGIWRRLELIGFNAKISDDEKELHFREEKLRPEFPAILAWMIRGCFMWQRDGLKPSAAVTERNQSLPQRDGLHSTMAGRTDYRRSQSEHPAERDLHRLHNLVSA